MINKEEYNYELPPELIAQVPAKKRDESWLMVLNRQKHTIEHKKFSDVINYIKPNDLLILNNTKVIPARLLGHKIVNGKESAKVEVLLLSQIEGDRWEVLVKPGQKIRPGHLLSFNQGQLTAQVVGSTDYGGRIVEFKYQGDFKQLLDKIGYVPLPPYIKVKEPITVQNSLAQRYQTVFAQEWGAAAAPTAGLHFTEELLKQIQDKGVKLAQITLHTGLGTFRPISSENIEEHKMHAEWFSVNQEAVDLIEATKAKGGRIIAVGTTVVRALESVYQKAGRLKSMSGMTDIFIYPEYKFHNLDCLITNFHLPMSSLLLMVAAFAGKDFIFTAYQEAIARKYRFFSFGDAMFIF